MEQNGSGVPCEAMMVFLHGLSACCVSGWTNPSPLDRVCGEYRGPSGAPGLPWLLPGGTLSPFPPSTITSQSYSLLIPRTHIFSPQLFLESDLSSCWLGDYRCFSISLNLDILIQEMGVQIRI